MTQSKPVNERLNLEAELYEIQVWLMWILALALYETGHFIIFFLVLIHSIFTFINTATKHIEDKINNDNQV